MPTKITPGWKFYHIGFEGDGVKYKDFDLWAHSKEWKSLNKTIVAAHPSYSDQRHSLNVYEIISKNLVFAAGEVSNGVYIFCIPS